jgi:hypothetical protein
MEMVPVATESAGCVGSRFTARGAPGLEKETSRRITFSNVLTGPRSNAAILCLRRELFRVRRVPRKERVLPSESTQERVFVEEELVGRMPRRFKHLPILLSMLFNMNNILDI